MNWTMVDLADSLVKSNGLLDDPSGLVRNNISRFTFHFVDKVQLQKNRLELIDRLLVQLDRPSHGDRNKAIYNLVTLAEKFPEDRLYMKAKGLRLIEDIASASILSNVRDPAAQLVKLLSNEAE